MEFKDRLMQACINNPNLPRYGEGLHSDIAKKMNASKQAVARWFSGECLPRYGNIVILSKLLDVDLHWLAAGDPAEEDQEFQLLDKPDNAGLHAFASFLVSQGCTLALDNLPSTTNEIMAVRSGKLFKFVLIGGHLNDRNELVFDHTTPSTADHNNMRPILYVPRESDSSFSSAICYDFVALDPMNTTDKILWWPKTRTYKQGMVTLQPVTVGN